jgi:ketosteroid isomerase-like protein
MKRAVGTASLFGLLFGMAFVMSCGDESLSDVGGADSTADTEKVVRKYFQLINEERMDEFFNLFDPNVDFHAPPNFSARGVENIKPYYAMVVDSLPQHVDTPVHVHASANRAAVFIEAEARLPNGRSVSFTASDWFTVEQGKITSVRIFFDLFAVAAGFR